MLNIHQVEGPTCHGGRVMLLEQGPPDAVTDDTKIWESAYNLVLAEVVRHAAVRVVDGPRRGPHHRGRTHPSNAPNPLVHVNELAH